MILVLVLLLLLQLARHLFQRGACSLIAALLRPTLSRLAAAPRQHPSDSQPAVSALPRRRWIVDDYRVHMRALRCWCSVDCGVAASAVFVLALVARFP